MVEKLTRLEYLFTPTGPWYALNISVDDRPWQNLTMLPSLTKSSLLIAEDACSQQNSACPNQVSTGDWPMWTSSAAHEPFLTMDSELFDASDWDYNVTNPLGLQKNWQYVHETFRLWNSDNESAALVYQATALTHNFTVNFPSGKKYTMNTGFFSLYGAENNISWLNATGFNVTQDLQLPTAKNQSLVSSVSYGLHIGSPSLGIEPSLIMGGYDRSLCLSEPLTTYKSFELSYITIGVAQDFWPFRVPKNNVTVLTQSLQNVSQEEIYGYLEVRPNPGVPYLYLPRAACDILAKGLPVTYNAEFNLYIWDTEDSAYEPIITSMTYLSFTLNSGGGDQEIRVPFALLNLTLDYPLASPPIQYFPCSPYTPAPGHPYQLGRAFLQAVLMAQNWETQSLWLSQAPGPDYTSPSTPVVIEDFRSEISSMPVAPDWAQTWNTTLKPLSSRSNSTTTSTQKSYSNLSGGAIAGIVVGVVVGLALLAAIIWFLLRRRRAAKRHNRDMPVQSSDKSGGSPNTASELEEAKAVNEAASMPIHEALSIPTRADPGELPAQSRKPAPVELPASGRA